MPFTAGQRTEFYEQGDFFRVMEATADLKIEFFRDGREIAEAVDVRGGYAERFENYFTSFAITSVSAQTVKFASRLASVVDYNQAPTGNVNVTNGSIAVTGPVTQAQLSATMLATTQPVGIVGTVPVSGPLTQAQLSATMLATTQPVDLMQADVDAIRRPEVASGFSSQNASMVANSAVQIFAPASNTNGALILSADCSFGDTSPWGLVALIGKNSAPTNVIDGEVFMTHLVSAPAGRQTSLGAKAYVKPGDGLYWIASTNPAAAAFAARSVRYKLL